MESFFDQRLLWVFLSGIPVGIFAIVLGGTMFLSLPIFQLFFPELSLGALVGNIKVGSAIRNAFAIWPLRRRLRIREIFHILVALLAGGFIGAFGITNVSQSFVLPVIVLAILVTEAAPWISGRISKSTYIVVAVLAGVFGGIIGAGISLIILSLLRIQIPDNDRIVEVRADAILLELINTLAAIVVFMFFGKLIFPLWVSWALGSIIGGYIGGHIVERTGRFPPAIQRYLLRAVFGFALAVAGYKLIS